MSGPPFAVLADVEKHGSGLKAHCGDPEHAESCDRTQTPWRSTVPGELAWTAYRAERRRRGETGEEPCEAYHPFRQGR
ncbi:hypothetical protein DIZ27_31860 [Streptomyces sp. NWU339]|uniref:hypothetical protein n=1 Tax=Streptomyces sp. NWU339 TaxID=2185284 RepID=UPI000D67A3E1|nr:hypothetical protein [Streptomyces sp. NWU339]PWI06710.1 hypothetical protein DIZ27_31860 [Streptomyces sp. NWU339]